ncbi:unnamed protein product [Sphagnum troendelagicum]|uniref:Uncharacterized protein n=1 Tax=Sphagnum troendelagicum TaxID=128251 RepID=A0ABP0TSS0_9BRYO
MRKSYRRNTLEENAFPLVVRIETVPRSPPPDVQSIENESLGAPLPKWIHSQTTQAVIEKKDDGDYRGVWVGLVASACVVIVPRRSGIRPTVAPFAKPQWSTCYRYKRQRDSIDMASGMESSTVGLTAG